MTRRAHTIADGGAAALRPSSEGTWILLCGAMSSGLPPWEGIHALRLVATWLVADATLRFVFRHLVGLKTAPADTRRGEDDVEHRAGLPRAWRLAAPHAWSVLMGAGLALSLATYVGRQSLIVAAGALLAAGLLALLAYDDAACYARWLRGLSITAAWLLGHTALGPLSGLSIGLALLAGLAAYAREVVTDHQRAAWWVLRWAWALLILASIQARQPLVTAVLATAALAEAMTRGFADRRGTDTAGGLRRRPGWLVSLAVVALASTYWG